MIFSQYTETCEVILDYPRIVVDAIEDYAKKFISNLYYEHIDVHSKIFIAVFPIDGIKCIGKLQSHCAVYINIFIVKIPNEFFCIIFNSISYYSWII